MRLYAGQNLEGLGLSFCPLLSGSWARDPRGLECNRMGWNATGWS